MFSFRLPSARRQDRRAQWEKTRRAEKWTLTYGPGRCACGGNLSKTTHQSHTPQSCTR